MEEWLEKYVWSHVDDGYDISDSELLISEPWLEFLDFSPFLKRKLYNLLSYVVKLRQNAEIYPSTDRIMYWSYLCDPRHIKVIILGQDPYHGGQADGLAFSVARDRVIPPSLKNIYNELCRSCPSFRRPTHGCLTAWTEQGVLLLNSILTVEKGKPGSHTDIGWTWLTNYIISSLSTKLDNCVFLLWGSKAIERSRLIDGQKHLILKASHPSPLALRSGARSNRPAFIGCNHFVLTNQYLSSHKRGEIDWSLE